MTSAVPNDVSCAQDSAAEEKNFGENRPHGSDIMSGMSDEREPEIDRSIWNNENDDAMRQI